ncbi:uncharacterized protein NEMAJ01_1325 [Nematocida major]|uniref:uncharacterized protein n=1 Tax=Nematocida major TaxID=1912982 RepID=UPI002008A314|nr:uncharacterized protein NEMAJ01_1325 [Nematocida major]KAH9386429.1 hypothetical protein NEMAJ01_1325 [Nematocida major]
MKDVYFPRLHWRNAFSKRNCALKSSPISKVPLMESSVETKKNTCLSDSANDPIKRPTRTIYISRNEVKHPAGLSAFKLCFLCNGKSGACKMCSCLKVCERREKPHLEEGSFVSAKQENSSDELHMDGSGMFGAACRPQHEKSSFVFCTLCSCRTDWPLVSLESDVYVVKFATIKSALLFHASHKSLLFMSWGHEPHEQRIFYETEKESIQLRILEKAFSLEESHVRGAGFLCEIGQSLAAEPKNIPCMGTHLEASKIRDFVCMASGRSSNVTLQMKIRELSQNDLLQTMSSLSPQVFFYLAKHKYGTYVIQLMISMIKEDTLVREVKRLMLPYSTGMLLHEIGNYVMQGMINFDKAFVFECFMKDFKKIASSKIGSRAFKSCIKHFYMYRQTIIQILTPNFIGSIPTDEQRVLRGSLKDLLLASEKNA